MTDVNVQSPGPSRTTVAERSSPSAVAKQHELQVTDTWPGRVPIMAAELETIEIWLKPLLDEVFGSGDK